MYEPDSLDACGHVVAPDHPPAAWCGLDDDVVQDFEKGAAVGHDGKLDTLESSYDIRTVQELLGHADVSTTMMDTMWRVGGISAFLTAATVVSLAEEGRLNLSTAIGSYVRDLHPAISRLALDQLLSRTAGVKEDHLMFALYDDAALGSFVRTWNEDWIIAEPGVLYSSSHPGYHDCRNRTG